MAARLCGKDRLAKKAIPAWRIGGVILVTDAVIDDLYAAINKKIQT